MNLTPSQRRVLEAVDTANRGAAGGSWDDEREERTYRSLERAGLIDWKGEYKYGRSGYYLSDAGKAELEKPAPTPAAAKQRASRATRKAAGAKMVSIMLTPEAAVALDMLRESWGLDAAAALSRAVLVAVGGSREEWNRKAGAPVSDER